MVEQKEMNLAYKVVVLRPSIGIYGPLTKTTFVRQIDSSLRSARLPVTTTSLIGPSTVSAHKRPINVSFTFTGKRWSGDSSIGFRLTSIGIVSDSMLLSCFGSFFGGFGRDTGRFQEHVVYWDGPSSCVISVSVMAVSCVANDVLFNQVHYLEMRVTTNFEFFNSRCQISWDLNDLVYSSEHRNLSSLRNLSRQLGLVEHWGGLPCHLKCSAALKYWTALGAKSLDRRWTRRCIVWYQRCQLWDVHCCWLISVSDRAHAFLLIFAIAGKRNVSSLHPFGLNQFRHPFGLNQLRLLCSCCRNLLYHNRTRRISLDNIVGVTVGGWVTSRRELLRY